MVQVRAVQPGRVKRAFGTGYLIAPRLVLTAGHEVGEAAGMVEVSRPGHRSPGFTGLVRWWQAGELVDAALIEVVDRGWKPPPSWTATRAAQRFGELVTTGAGQRVTARGFPRLQREPGGRFDEQVDGRVSPGTGMLPGRYEVISDDPLPAPADDDRSQWAGMSGAALFSGTLLVGVIRSDRGARHGARLAATRIRDVLSIPEAAGLVGAHSGGVPVVEPVELAGVLDPALVARDLRSPAMLLRADAEAVGFHGRSREQDLLLGWVLSERGDTPVRVLTGPGGQGKTRLARWLIAAARKHGCSAGMLVAGLSDGQGGGSADLKVFGQASGPVLVVVDYAESRPLAVRRLIEVSRDNDRRVRLLLLARATGPWKTELQGSSGAVHEVLVSAPEIELGPLDVSASERAVAFAGAVRDLATFLGQVQGHDGIDWPTIATEVSQPGGLSADQYRSALTVQMTALARLLQAGPGKVTAGPGEPVEAVLLRHEQRYWERTAQAHYLGELPGLMLGRAVAAACLCGAASEEQAASTLARLQHLPPDKLLTAVLWLRQLYPASGERFWGSLQPDRVAEFHASALVAETAGLLTTLLTGAEPDQQIQAVTVLTRSVVAHANAGRSAAGQELLSQLTVALDQIHAEPAVLQACGAALPRYSQALTDFGVKLAKDLARQYRQLAAVSPGLWEPPLATSLHSLSVRTADAARPAESLAAAEEAVEIGRRVKSAEPAYAADLGTALANLAVQYVGADRLAEGRAAAEDSVATYRQLATADRDAREPGLAMTLHNLALVYGKTRQAADALAAIKEALAIRRRLAAADPDAYQPSLAESLTNLSARLDQAEAPGEALTANLEAVALLRELAAANPDGHAPRLASSLSHLSQRYGNLDIRDQAKVAIEKAVAILERLAETKPEIYETELTAALAKMRDLSRPPSIAGPATVISHGLGVTAQAIANMGRRNLILIRANERIPVKMEIFFRTSEDSQAELKLELNEGDDEDLNFVKTIGTATLPLPPGMPAGTQIGITMGVAADGILRLQAYDHDTTLMAELKIERPGNLTEEERQQARNLLAGLRRAP